MTGLTARSEPSGPPRPEGNAKRLPDARFPVETMLIVVAFGKLEQALARVGAELGREVDVAELFDTLLDRGLATNDGGDVSGRKRVDVSTYRVRPLDTGRRGEPYSRTDKQLTIAQEAPWRLPGYPPLTAECRIWPSRCCAPRGLGQSRRKVERTEVTCFDIFALGPC